MAEIEIGHEWGEGYVLPPPGNMMEAHEHRVRVFVNQGTLMANAVLKCIRQYKSDRDISSLQILDFGCGVGRVALPLFHKFRKPDYCVDVDPAAVAYLKKVIPEAHPLVSSFEPPLPFTNDSFDVIYGISVWTHLPADSAAEWLGEIKRVLRPGGLALLTTSNYAALAQRRTHPKLGPMGWDQVSDEDLRREGFIFREAPSTTGTGLYGMASHDPAWIRSEWSRFMPVIGIESGAILGVQDINVLEKAPAAESTMSRSVPEGRSTPESRVTTPIPELKRRLIHLHIPKTGGTAVRAAFEQRFRGLLRVFPEWRENKFASINPEDFDFYSGHIGFDTADRLAGDIITLLRNPIDRFVSVYFFWRQLYETGAERSTNTELAAKHTLEDFARINDQPGLLEEFQNRCTFQVAYGASLNQRRQLRLQGLTDDMIFRRALVNLERFKVIGIQEKMGHFADVLAKTFGVALDIKKINETRGRPDIASMSINTRRAILDWVYMDMELYQYALQYT